MKLYISGGVHIQRESTIRDRADTSTSKLGEVDAVFSEGWEGIGVSKKDRFWNWLATPFMFLAMGIYSKGMSMIFFRTDRCGFS